MNKPENNDNQPFDINKISDLLNNSNSTSYENTTAPPNYLVTSSALDQVIHNENMQIMKAAIPYLEHNTQKSLAIIIKFMELKKTFELYKDDSFTNIQELNMMSRPREDMLQTIRSVCSDQNKNLVDILINMFNINKLYKNYKQFTSVNSEKESKSEANFNSQTENNTTSDKESDNTSSQQPKIDNSMVDNLKNMLTPEQRNMFDMLSTMMKTTNQDNQEKENDINE